MDSTNREHSALGYHLHRFFNIITIRRGLGICNFHKLPGDSEMPLGLEMIPLGPDAAYVSVVQYSEYRTETHQPELYMSDLDNPRIYPLV